MSIHRERPRAAADLADEALRYLDAVEVFASLDADPHAAIRARAACARAREERAAQQASTTERKAVLRWRS
jgi:putative ubiquitin-RnfH superfamily antitoxin RatB of RatAB toxin-antitoxin module